MGFITYVIGGIILVVIVFIVIKIKNKNISSYYKSSDSGGFFSRLPIIKNFGCRKTKSGYRI